MIFLVFGIIQLLGTILFFILTLISKAYILLWLLIPLIIELIVIFTLYDTTYYLKQAEKEIEELRTSLNECRQMLNLPLISSKTTEEDIDKNSPDYFDENSPDFEDAFCIPEDTPDDETNNEE